MGADVEASVQRSALAVDHALRDELGRTRPGQGASECPARALCTHGPNDLGRAREERLYEALGLALDSFALMSVDEGPRFASAPLAEQLSQIEELAQGEAAVGVTWVVQRGPGAALLYVAVVQTGRVLIRQLEPGRVSGRDADVALAVRELLGAAYLFEPRTPAATRTALSELVDEVRRQVTAPPASAAPEASRWAFFGSAQVGSAFTASSWQLGASAWAEYRIGSALLVSAGGEVTSGPVMRNADVELQGLALGGGAGLFYAFTVGQWALGPRFAAMAVWRHLSAQGAQASTRIDTLEPKLVLGFEVRPRLSPQVALRLAPRVTFWPQQNRVWSRTSGLEVGHSPSFEGGLELGVLLQPSAD